MAIHYGNQYDPTATYAGSQLDTGTSHVTTPGLLGGRVRYKLSTVTGGDIAAMTTGSEIRLCSMKSSDVLIAMYVSCEDGLTTATAVYGFYLQEEAGGTVVEIDVVAADWDADGDHNRVDVYHSAQGDVGFASVGLANWQLANLGTPLGSQAVAADYTKDPCETWDLTLTWVGDVAGTTTSPLTHEIWYVAT